MTHKETIQYALDTFGCGHMNFRAKAPHQTMDQWRWRCSHRDALQFAKLMWPYAIVKLHKLESIIDHYEPRAQELGDNVVDLETERIIRRVYP